MLAKFIKFKNIGTLFLLSLLFLPTISFAKFSAADEYIIGEVVSQEIIPAEQDFLAETQRILIKVTDGIDKLPENQQNNTLTISQEITDKQLSYNPGEKIVIGYINQEGEAQYYIHDRYRYPYIIWGILIFFAVVIIFGKMQGFRSILGLALSIFVIMYLMVPLLLKGYNPIAVSIFSALFISVFSLYLAHGLKRRTHIALLSTVITFTLSTILAIIAVNSMNLFGFGSEEAMFLLDDSQTSINLKGLLLGGIIIGMLGVLDDITTSQAAAIDEIYKANSKLSFKELYNKGISIGKEHIASLVNTLALAYAGVGLPLFMLFAINTKDPAWVVINSEFIAEEIVRTLIGSIALILAVPITTYLATYLTKKWGASSDPAHQHYH